MSNIHPTAVVHATAKIDPSAKVGPFAVIGEDVVIGADCSVGAHAHVEFTHMGKGNRLFPGCFVGGAPQDLKYEGEHALLVMGDKNTVRDVVYSVPIAHVGTPVSVRLVIVAAVVAS